MSTIIITMATKCSRVVTDHKGLLPIKSHAHLITWLWNFTWQTKKIIFTIWYIMVTKPGRLMICNRELPFLHDLSTRWLFEVIRQIKCIKLLTILDQWPPIYLCYLNGYSHNTLHDGDNEELPLINDMILKS